MIRVLIASRGRPTQLAAAVWSLWTLASEVGRKDIAFCVSMDEDDAPTEAMCRELRRELPVDWWTGPRPNSSHALHNRVVQHVDSTASVVIWNDRLVCVSPLWDTTVKRFVKDNPTRVSWWDDHSTVLTGSMQWVMPPAYLDAINREICPNIFPFWFDDLWHFEIDWFISQRARLLMPIASAGIHKTTRRGREFRFWTEVFIKTRPKRIAIAELAAKKLGLPFTAPTPSMVAHYEKNDRWQLANSGYLEKCFGDPSEPGPEYEDAKNHAEELLKETPCLQ